MKLIEEAISHLLPELLDIGIPEGPEPTGTHHWVGDFHSLLWAWVKWYPWWLGSFWGHSAIRLNLTHRNLMIEHLQLNYQQINSILGHKTKLGASIISVAFISYADLTFNHIVWSPFKDMFLRCAFIMTLICIATSKTTQCCNSPPPQLTQIRCPLLTWKSHPTSSHVHVTVNY